MITLCEDCYSGKYVRYTSPPICACEQCGRHDDKCFGGSVKTHSYPVDPRKTERSFVFKEVK